MGMTCGADENGHPRENRCPRSAPVYTNLSLPPDTAKIELNRGAAAVSYDSRKWGKLEKVNADEFTLDRLTGPGVAILISERIGIPSEMAAKEVLEELKAKHPDLQVLSRETRSVSGHEVCCVKYSLSRDGAEYIVYTYIYGGLAGTLQLRTCTSAANFAECEADFTEFLNGLEIRLVAHPLLARVRQGFGFASVGVVGAAWSIVGVGIWYLTDWKFALPLSGGMAVALFLWIWIYDVVKFKLR
jgi:hypothetical protein